MSEVEARTGIDKDRPVHNVTIDTIQAVSDLMFAPWVQELKLEWLVCHATSTFAMNPPQRGGGAMNPPEKKSA